MIRPPAVQAKATAGASGTDTGVAGSFALNIVNAGSGSVTEAGIRSSADVNAGSGNVLITAVSTTDNEARAEAQVEGGEATGVGAAIAIQVVDNDVFATVANGATLAGGNNVTLIATGSHDTTIFARGGAAGTDTAVGGSVSIVVADNKTHATLGTGGTELDIGGNFSATATHHGSTSNTAKGDSAGATAVGAAIALSFVFDEAEASTARNLLADGSIAFGAHADGSSTVEALASAVGANKSEEEAAMDYAAAVNEEIKDLFAAGADVVQIDEPYMQARPEKARQYGLAALNRALEGVQGTTCVHICFGYAAIIHERPSGYSFLPELAGCRCNQVSLETAQSNLDTSVLTQLADKQILLGCIDLSDLQVETPEVVAKRVRKALAHVTPEQVILAPDCGMKYLPRDVAQGKLQSMVAAAKMLREEYGAQR